MGVQEDATKLTVLASSLKDIKASLTSSLETVDKIMDGLTVSVMYFSDYLVHPRFQQSFMQSDFAVLQALSRTTEYVHLWQVSLLVLVISTYVQHLSGSEANTEEAANLLKVGCF